MFNSQDDEARGRATVVKRQRSSRDVGRERARAQQQPRRSGADARRLPTPG